MASADIPVPMSRFEAVATPNRKRRDLAELVVGYGLIFGVIWTPRSFQRPLYCAAIVWIAAAIWRSFDGWQTWGIRTANFLRSLWVVGLALLAAAAAVLLAARLHTLHPPPGAEALIATFWGYALWSLVQQFLLQDFFLLRLQRLLPAGRSAVFAAAGLFAFAHLPNPVLTPLTFIWGFGACLLFLRYRNLFPLGIAHAIFGICLAVAIPGHVIHNMRVGLGYLTYAHDHPRHRSH
jgi:hypothetical protein